MEREFLAQRAKSDHINLSDKCNKYLHSLLREEMLVTLYPLLAGMMVALLGTSTQ